MKRAGDVAIGDVIVAVQPMACHCRVTGLAANTATMAYHRRTGRPGLAVIVVVEVLDGPEIGWREAAYLHPDDQVQVTRASAIAA